MVALIVDDLIAFAQRSDVHVPADGAAIRRAFEDHGPLFPSQGVGFAAAWAALGRDTLNHAVNVSSPRYVAHYLATPSLESMAIEIAVGALNQSMDSFDQGPSATVLESMVVEMMCDAAGFPNGDGVFVAGASMSNLMALLIARDRGAVGEAPSDTPRLRIVASELSHFSVAQAAGIIGLPAASVITVAVDSTGAMDRSALAETMGRATDSPGTVCVVVTLGTTDTGAFDPLDMALDVAATAGAWVHVDAAASGALLLSDRHRHRLAGLDRADSVGLDFHKLGWQSVPSGCFLVRDRHSMEAIRHHSEYLNPSSEPDLLNLAWKSIQTTRRFDALKLVITLRSLGHNGFDALLDAQFRALAHAIDRVDAEPELERGASGLHTVLFRHHPVGMDDEPSLDRHNQMLRSTLAESGAVALGRSRFDGRSWLKIQSLNPLMTPDDVDDIFDIILGRARVASGGSRRDATPGSQP